MPDDPNLDPALRPGRISALTARQPLQTATLPGQGALDESTQYGVPTGTPLMNIRGQVNPGTGQTEYRDVTGGAWSTQRPQESSDDLISRAIQSRQQFEVQRQSLINQLPYANKRTQTAIAAQLHGIDASERAMEWEASQRRIMAHESAMEADKKLSTDRSTEIDEQGSAMLQTMGHLDSMLRHGEITKDDYDSALLKAGQDYPLASRHPEAAKHYEFAITEADKHNEFVKRHEFTEASKIGAKYGIGVQVDPDTGLPSVEHTKLAAMQTDKGRTETLTQLNREMFEKYGIGTGVSSLFNPIKEHTSDDKGKSINLPSVDPKTGKAIDVKIPTPLFNQMKADFGPRYFQATQPTETTQPSAPTTVTQGDKYITGKQYRDAQGNTATYLGGGKWQQ